MTGFDQAASRRRIDELLRLDEIEADKQRRLAEERTALLAERYERAALGSHRKDHKPPPYPADAPPLPPPSRRDWTSAQLFETARWMAGCKLDRGIAAEVIVGIGRRCGIAKADIVDALRELLT